MRMVWWFATAAILAAFAPRTKQVACQPRIFFAFLIKLAQYWLFRSANIHPSACKP